MSVLIVIGISEYPANPLIGVIGVQTAATSVTFSRCAVRSLSGVKTSVAQFTTLTRSSI
jgi:hypothetical protein